MTRQIFISYSKKDSSFAQKLADDLQAAGFEIWIDRSITGGEKWREEIESNLKSAKEVIVVLSQNALDSQWVPYEGALAVGWAKSLYPLLIEENIPIPPWLHEVQYINFTDKSYQQAFDELKNALTPPNPVQDLLDQELKAYRATGDLIGEAILRVIEESHATLEIDDEAQELITRSQQAIEARQQSELEKAQQLVATQRQRTIVLALGLLVAVILSVISFLLFQQSNNNLSDAQAANTQSAANAATATHALGLSEQSGTQAAANAATAEARRIEAENAQSESEKQRKIAISNQFASQARALMTEQFDLALLLAIEALCDSTDSASCDSTEGQLSLSTLLLAEPHLIRIVSNPEDYFGQGEAGFIKELALSLDGNQLVALSDGNNAGFWDFDKYESREISLDEYQKYLADWSPFQSPYQTPSPGQEELIYNPDIWILEGASSAVGNRVALSGCRTKPSAGGAPGCASRIFIFDPAFNRLVTPLASCNPTENVKDFRIELEGGLYRIRDLQSLEDQPTNFILYSVALANKATNYPSEFVGALFDRSTNRLVTAAAVGRHSSELALSIWDLDEQKPVIELFYPLWGSELAKLNYSNDGKTVDVCVENSGIRVDIYPISWREQACEIAGRNLTLAEWEWFIGNKTYKPTCSQWPSGE